MRKLMLISMIPILLSAPANAREALLVCAYQGSPGVRFNLRVDFDNSLVTYSSPDGSSRYHATITADNIEYSGGILRTRVDRVNGDFVIWNSAGKRIGSGSCNKVNGPAI